jgi:hypothetical protein
MKPAEKDILRDNPQLKAMPFETPSGYFETLKDGLKAGGIQPSVWIRTAPYVALAAMFTVLVAAGGFFLTGYGEDEFTEEDYIVFSEDMTNTIFYDSDLQYADALTEDDIIEYLIHSDVDVEELYSNDLKIS